MIMGGTIDLAYNKKIFPQGNLIVLDRINLVDRETYMKHVKLIHGFAGCAQREGLAKAKDFLKRKKILFPAGNVAR